MKNKNAKYYFGGVLVIIIILIFIGGRENRDLANNQFGGSHNQVSEEVAKTKDAPLGNFVLKNLDGEDMALTSYIGEKPVILDFWATWCPNCRRDMSRLSSFYEKYRDQVEVIGVNLQERDTVVRKYVEDAGIKFPIVFDPSGVAARMFGVRFTNYHVLINTDGTLAGTVPGDISEEHIIELIKAQPTRVEVPSADNL